MGTNRPITLPRAYGDHSENSETQVAVATFPRAYGDHSENSETQVAVATFPRVYGDRSENSETQVAVATFPRAYGATTLKRPVYHTLGVCFFKASLPVDRSDVEGTTCCYRESPSRYFICEVFLRATHERLVPP